MAVPYAAIAQGAGDSMQALAQYFGDAETRKQQKWSFGQRKDLYDLLRWHTYGKQGMAITPEQMTRIMNSWRDSMKPTFAGMSHAASRNAGMRSGQTQNLLAQQRLPLEAGFRGAMEQKNLDMTQQQKQFLLQMMAQLAGGQ